MVVAEIYVRKVDGEKWVVDGEKSLAISHQESGFPPTPHSPLATPHTTILSMTHTRSNRRNYDALIIGGGHNGLVTAAYLARDGKKVAVLERRHVLGGCSVTEELWPGYKISTAAYVISLFRPEIIRDLRLRDYGLAILPRDPSSFTPLLDGRSLLLGNDPRAASREIAKFSLKDAESWPKYQAFLDRVGQAVEPIFSQPAPNPLPLSSQWRTNSLGRKFGDLSRLWDGYQSFAALGDDLPAALDLLTGSARSILEQWFESEVLRTTLATDAVIGAFASPSYPGTAYTLLHHVMGEAGGARGVWGYVQGGMGGLANSLAGACHDLNVDILPEADVRRILLKNGKAAGVVLADGSILEAPVVASSVDAHNTFEVFLQPDELPESFRREVAKIDYQSGAMKINLALSELPDFRCLPGVGPQHRGTIHIAPTMDYLEKAFDDAKYGLPSREPMMEITLPSSVDPTLAPEGKHVMSIFVQYTPYRLANGKTWDETKEAYADQCLAILSRYAPNIPAAVLHRQVLSPVDLERTFGLTGGNIMQGSMNFRQLYFQRPVAGWADHRTPVSGLYLCGAASHPGGGVIGLAGKNAAAAILQDRVG